VLSSNDASALAQLESALISAARREHRRAQVFLPYAASEVIARVYATCRVLATEATETGLEFTIEAAQDVIAKIERASEELQS
jgi:50S ribosomal subunit-associated GTPase HflX